MESAKERIEAESLRAEAGEGQRGRAQAQVEGLAVVLKGMRQSPGSVVRVEAQEETPSGCWACVPSPFGSLAPWVRPGGGSAWRRARRPVT